MEVLGGDRTQKWQSRHGTEVRPERRDRWLDSSEFVRQQADQDREDRPHRTAAPPRPPDRSRELDAGPELVGSGLHARGGLDCSRNLFDFGERAAEPRREAAGQKAEGFPRLATVAASDLAAWWLDPRVRVCLANPQPPSGCSGQCSNVAKSHPSWLTYSSLASRQGYRICTSRGPHGLSPWRAVFFRGGAPCPSPPRASIRWLGVGSFQPDPLAYHHLFT